MGVPKFFRYISERYPCLSELAREHKIPDFDNLYLDMNGIIHNCSHPDDTDIHLHITEDDMFQSIFNYIDKLFFLIKPKKLFFMAVDGVAPRAKMNQQRSRRFRSAKEVEILEMRARNRGEELTTDRFDSNCITPGTEFMERLHKALRYFIKRKISVDPMWQTCRVILSGQDSPGEGEHKIMDYIRYLKSQKGYNPDTRHCLYGLDADLIILGLCTHEINFAVLREEVKFGRKSKKAALEETRFFLLHLGLFREYLQLEFHELYKQNPSLDIANLIDDWVLMGFLVGNDFIPHLPCLHITSNALPLLYKTYISVYPTLGGNINVHGKLNLERLEKYLAALSEVEFKLFTDNYADLKYFEAKQLKDGIDEAFDIDIKEISNNDPDNDLAALIKSTQQLFNDDDSSSDEEKHISAEFETYKRNYYMKKLHQDELSDEFKREIAISYITALQWILDYYYRGVQSWEWYYPYHYAPFVSDVKDFKHFIKIEFKMGRPFLPFQQLLAVLPAASRNLLPMAYRNLMTSPNSELKHFYPSDFKTDLNGKKQEWEAVVLIPFIDENLLLKAMKSCEEKLTASEINRNKHGPMLQYDYSTVSQGSTPGLYSFKALHDVFCTEKAVWSHEITVPSNKAACMEMDNASRNVFFPGFPTMKHLKYDFKIETARVKVFDQPSRNENLILMPINRPAFDNIFFVAEKFLNQVVYIGWPHLVKAKVLAVLNKEKSIDADGVKDIDSNVFQLHSRTVQEHLTQRMGIEFKDFSVLVEVKVHIGTTYVCGNQGRIAVKDAWSSFVINYPAQGIVSEISIYSEKLNQNKQIETIFPVNSTIFFVGNPYFGSEGIVLNPLLFYECGRLKINITVLPEPDFTDAKAIQKRLESDYISSYQASALIGIHSKCLGRITGTILVVAGKRRSNCADSVPKTNIGLQFKFPKQQEERTGYARRINGQWYYSSKAIALIQSYCSKFPTVVNYLAKCADRDEFYFEGDLFPDNIGKGILEEFAAWLKNQNHINTERITCGSESVEKEAVEKLLESVRKLKSLPLKTVKLQVKPHLLLKPDLSLPEMYKPRRALRLFDRVVVVKTTYMVPIGSRGTVVGIYPVTDPNPVRLECLKKTVFFFEVLFDKRLPNGNSIHGIATERVFRVPESSILLIYNHDIKPNQNLDNKCTNSVSDTASKTLSNCSIPRGEPMKNNNLSLAGNRSLLHAPVKCAITSQIGARAAAEDFWMPAVNATRRQSTPLTSVQIPHPLGRNFPTRESDSVTSSECQAGTQVLKNLLGLAENHHSTSASGSNSKQITLPPPPPVNWRIPTTKPWVSTHQMRNQTSYNHDLKQKILPAWAESSVPLRHIANQKQIYERSSENLPRSSFKHKTIKQKDALTPVPENTYYPALHISTEISRLSEDKQNQEGLNAEMKNIQSTKENNTDTLNTTNLTKPPVTHVRAPRIPKLGAKFDYAV